MLLPTGRGAKHAHAPEHSTLAELALQQVSDGESEEHE